MVRRDISLAMRTTLYPLFISFVLLIHADAGAGTIFSAAVEGDLESLREEIEMGADVDGRDQQGWTALMHASKRGRFSAAEYLVSKGAEINTLSSRGNFSPLILAAGAGYEEVVELLLSWGGNINIRDEKGVTPLLAATIGKHPLIVKRLIERGADVNAQTVDRVSVLTAAVFSAQKEIVEMLLLTGADVNARGSDLETPLMVAAGTGDREIVTMLLEHGADPKLKDRERRTAIFYSEAKNFTEISKIIGEFKSTSKR